MVEVSILIEKPMKLAQICSPFLPLPLVLVLGRHVICIDHNRYRIDGSLHATANQQMKWRVEANEYSIWGDLFKFVFRRPICTYRN